MTRIGDKNVVYQTILLLPDGVPGEFDFTLGSWNVNIRIIFESLRNKDQGAISWAQLDDTLEIVFRGMDNPLGTAAKTPLKLGAASNGENLGFLFFHHKAGSMNRLDFSFLLGGKYE
jgi:hypothetical protein